MGLCLDGVGYARHFNSQLRAGSDSRAHLFAVALLAASVSLGRLSQQERDSAGINLVGNLHGIHRQAYKSGMLEVLRSDYIRTARSKGLTETDVVVRHALRGGLMPVVSFTGPALAFL